MGKTWLHLTREQCKGIFIIVLTIVVFAIGRYVYFSLSPTPKDLSLSPADEAEVKEFVRQIKQDSIAARKRRRAASEQPTELFVFDPNTIDSLDMLRLGFRPWQAHNNLLYRRKGGHWRSAEHFSKLYGLTASQFSRLRPYIEITPTAREIEKAQRQTHYDSVRRLYPEKFAAGTVIDANEADTNQLKKIPGIGSYYAQKICRYRERLGGFVAVSQLKEIDGLPAGVEQWFSVQQSENHIKQIKINKASFKELIRHPYLNYEQVKAIVNYRQKRGDLHEWKELSLSMSFTDKDFARLSPYFSFE